MLELVTPVALRGDPSATPPVVVMRARDRVAQVSSIAGFLGGVIALLAGHIGLAVFLPVAGILTAFAVGGV